MTDLEDASPGVELLRLVGNVGHPKEQVELWLALISRQVQVDALQGLAHLSQQLGLAHA